MNNFKSFKELCENLMCSSDVEFEYNGKEYSITPIDEGISILEKYNYSTEQTYIDIVDVGDYVIGNKLLKDIVRDLKVTLRSF
ncbi:MAG: hypothetical protein N4A50_04290 [Vallitalea sp.]|jgi:hypothetical protein|nr:hypothetical protein [Vallitalea sp.]